MRLLLFCIVLFPFALISQENDVLKKSTLETLVEKVQKQQTIQKKKLQNVTYSFYEKSIISAHPDSVTGKIDTLFANKKKSSF